MLFLGCNVRIGLFGCCICNTFLDALLLCLFAPDTVLAYPCGGDLREAEVVVLLFREEDEDETMELAVLVLLLLLLLTVRTFLPDDEDVDEEPDTDDAEEKLAADWTLCAW